MVNNMLMVGSSIAMRGSGSGFLADKKGYVLTNHHVIEGADDIEVTLFDNRNFKASVIGTDPTTDLALIRIKADNLNSIPMANSDDVKVGEWVLAVGNPFNLTSTVTAGIISAKGRNLNILQNQWAVESFLQTDAAINPGNSGGALVESYPFPASVTLPAGGYLTLVADTGTDTSTVLYLGDLNGNWTSGGAVRLANPDVDVDDIGGSQPVYELSASSQ